MTVFLLITLLASYLMQTQANSDLGYCEKPSETCTGSSSDLTGNKYIFYDVNPPEGFNLRRDVYMRFAIMLAEARKHNKHENWHLVLPPWHNLYHWRHSRKNPIPWGSFFDIPSLKSYAPVLELYEAMGKDKLVIDRLYVLQHYPNAFENGDFTEKWELVPTDCQYNKFWGLKNVTATEVVCVRFQGKASMLWELVNLHPNDKYVMFAHGEIPLHDVYGTKEYWDCRKSMKFNKELVTIAENYIKHNLNCTETTCNTYISVHWRRGDFARSRRKDVPSIEGTAKQIDKAMKQYKAVTKIFIATDAWENEVKYLRDILEKKYEVHFYVPNAEEYDKYQDGGIAIIDQIICSRAKYFIGTHESTFSFRIQEEREILGFKSETTFNRLCPDTGVCEKPSRWTIVN